MMLILNRVETNVNQTLLEHGLTLSHDYLQTLHDFRKAAANSEKPVAQETDSIETKSPSICPTVSLTIHESEMPQLMKEPLPRVEQQQKVVATSLSSLPPVVVPSTLVPATARPKVICLSKKRECNKFVEHIELTKQVSTPSTCGLPIVKIYNQIAPAVKNSNVQANTFKPLTKTPLHSVSNGVGNIPSVTNPQTVVLNTLPNSQAKSRSVRVVSRVQIIRLSDEKLQVFAFYLSRLFIIVFWNYSLFLSIFFCRSCKTTSRTSSISVLKRI